MLGGPCSQHVTGNTSRQNQPQSAIKFFQMPTHIIEIIEAWKNFWHLADGYLSTVI